MAAGRPNLEESDDRKEQSSQRWKTVGRIAGGIALAGLTAFGAQQLYADRDRSYESSLFRRRGSTASREEKMGLLTMEDVY